MQEADLSAMTLERRVGEHSAVFRSLAALVDNARVDRSTVLQFEGGHYRVSYQPYDDLGLSYYCPRLGPNWYQVIIDKGLAEPQRRVVLFHELVELFLYHTIGVRPEEKAHGLATQKHKRYATRRGIAAPEQ